MNKINVNKRDLTFFLLGIITTLLISWFSDRKKQKSETSNGTDLL